MPPSASAILFDLDGTLVDSGRDLADAANATLAGFGLRPLPEPVIRGFVGDGLEQLLRRCLGPAHLHHLPDALRIWPLHYGPGSLRSTRLYPGIRDLLSDLSRGPAPLAVVSNKPEVFCRSILEGLDVARWFREVAGGDTFSEKKPSPEPLLGLCARLGADPPAAVFVGDGVQDLRAARAAGMPAVAVLWGFSAPEVIAAEQPDSVVRSVSELRALLGA